MRCVLCARESDESKYFEDHHLFPGKRRRVKVDRKEDTIVVCRDCGDQIHLMFDNRELRDTLDSPETLRQAIQSFIKWVQIRPLDQKVNMKMKKRKL
jgi:tRNA threonylcarbamoyladenosine modification (KEOPS) complex  Pcc1 subunit